MDKSVERQQWCELYEYVKHEILGYDDNMKLPKNLVLRLRGLKDGKFMANKNIQPLGYYDFGLILLTFKLNKFDIKSAISNDGRFKDENHKINYILRIIESKINDTYVRVNRNKKAQEDGETIEIDLMNSDNKAKYKSKTKEVKNSRLKDLM